MTATPTKTRIPTLYSGAYGYRDCDPLGHIVATTIDGWNSAMREAIDDETARSQEQCDHAGTFLALCEPDECDECEGTLCPCCHPDIWYVGPYAESALAYLREASNGATCGRWHDGTLDVRPRMWARQEIIDNLRASGVAYV